MVEGADAKLVALKKGLFTVLKLLYNVHCISNVSWSFAKAI